MIHNLTPFFSQNADILDGAIIYDRDLGCDYFALKTLQSSFLTKVAGRIVERPQHLFMRLSVAIHRDDMPSVLNSYHSMSQHLFAHASTALLNVGTSTQQTGSRFLICLKDNTMGGVFETLKDCALISECAGGTGISVHNVQAAHGIVPTLRIFNASARFGCSGRSEITVFLEPWHADIFKFLDLKKKNGEEEERARDLLYALWIPDLFMERVQSSGQWSLFCPGEAPGLADCWGEDFQTLYAKYETEGKARKVVAARSLWIDILNSQIETGMPFMMFKDSCNRKSNQMNLGTIKSSSVCAEIIEYTSPEETAVCNLASISLPKFVREKGISVDAQPSKLFGSKGYENRYFDFGKLAEITTIVTENLNKVIDINFYPVEAARRSNLCHRPIGIGVQGLADVFILLGMPFDSPEARKLNVEIFETIYYHSLRASALIASRDGPYNSYLGSPISKGILQPDMWQEPVPSDRWDWPDLRSLISLHGVRNSLLVALMPTASTSQILGDGECFEPYSSNIFNCRMVDEEFAMVNKHLLHDLTEIGLWSPSLKDSIINNNGSVLGIPQVPDHLKAIYKTVWEIEQETLVDMAVERGCYIDQSQCLNIHMEEPNIEKLTSLHFHAWVKGLKTGMYYLRTCAGADTINFTGDTTFPQNNEEVSDDFEEKMAEIARAIENRETIDF